MHAILSRESVLAICHFLCQAGSGHGTSGEGDTYQMAAEILVALTASREHLDMVRGELMQVLAVLVMDIEAALSKCEATTAEPSTMESRFLRVVRTLGEVFNGDEYYCDRPDEAEDPDFDWKPRKEQVFSDKMLMQLSIWKKEWDVDAKCFEPVCAEVNKKGFVQEIGRASCRERV